MIDQTSAPGKYLRSLTMIYFGLLVAQIAMGIVMIFIQSGVEGNEAGAELKNIFMFVVPVAVLIMLIASNFLFKNQLKKIKPEDDLALKIRTHQTASIARFALVEAAYFFPLVVYLLTGDYTFLIAAAVVLFYFIVVRPTRGSISVDLELSHSERAAL